MQIIKVDDKLVMKGIDLNWSKVEFRTIKPGTLVHQIGDGMQNDIVDTNYFMIPLKYEGTINLMIENKEESCLGFQYPGKDPQGNNIYVLYRVDPESQLLYQSGKIVAPEFHERNEPEMFSSLLASLIFKH